MFSVASFHACAAASALSFFVSVSLLSAAEAPADGLIASPEAGWPQWRGPRRDAVSRETGLLPAWPTGGPKVLWRFDGLGRGWSSPIVVGGLVVVTGDIGPDLFIYAFDLDGKLKWKTTNGQSWTGSYDGARACCAYSEGRLYHMNAHGRVACLDAGTGRELWAVNILERFEGKNITWAMSENLLVDGPRLIVTPGGAKAMMAALDKTNGQPVWQSEPIADDQAGYSSPILFRLAGRRLLTSCSGRHAFGVDAESGKLLWKVPLENKYHATVSTPIYGDGQVYYVTPDGPDGSAYRLRATAQSVEPELAWRTDIDGLTGSGVLTPEGTLYASGYRNLKSWRGVDWKTGRTVCEYKDLTTGAPLYAEGRLYIVAEDGRVSLLKPVAGGLEVAGQFQLDTKMRRKDAWAHPVLLDGRLYVRFHDTLWCHSVAAGGQP